MFLLEGWSLSKSTCIHIYSHPGVDRIWTCSKSCTSMWIVWNNMYSTYFRMATLKGKLMINPYVFCTLFLCSDKLNLDRPCHSGVRRLLSEVGMGWLFSRSMSVAWHSTLQLPKYLIIYSYWSLCDTTCWSTVMYKVVPPPVVNGLQTH